MDIDAKIQQTFDDLQLKKKEVSEYEATVKRSWVTTCSAVVPYRQTPLNIQTAGEDDLITFVSFLNSWFEAAKQLDIRKKFCGFDKPDWIEDCRKRKTMIVIRERKAELERLETRLNGIISPEQRREMELKAILKEMA